MRQGSAVIKGAAFARILVSAPLLVNSLMMINATRKIGDYQIAKIWRRFEKQPAT
jgi:hypothetical protein